MRQTYDTIVLGGGASGMAAAVSAAEHGRKTLLLEKGNRIGKKILASGNGRCNIMNTGKPRYYGDADFAGKVVENCTAEDLGCFFRRYGLLVREEKEGRVYPVTMQAVSVLNALQYALKINRVDLFLNAGEAEIVHTGGEFLCRTADGTEYMAERLIVCTGGAAQQKLGGSFDGYRLLRAMGHRLVPVFPSLVPIVTDRKSVSGLSGIRAHGTVSLMDGKTLIHREKGEILFTDYGLSGICVMQCSRFACGKSGLHIEIDLISDVFPTQKEAVAEMVTRRDRFRSFSPVTLLEGILVPKLAYAVLKQAGIPLRGETADSVTDADLARIVQTACRYKVQAIETRTLDDAQVTAGGISCTDFDPQTMESRLERRLYAAGEVLNVDGDCGGFNLMFAFASGLIAGGFRKGDSFIPEGKIQ